ncbi:MAG: Gfo/Idh/MocA family oxidoreductase [Oscillospiraceae bacterium]|nr:Gfo/Idh/MocA family oxidoreductase [Oscillospiraceae bacterium]
MAMFLEGKLGVGIRGTGQVAVQHAEAIAANPYVYVAAVCGRSKEKAQLLIDKLAPGAKAYDNYEDMLCDAKVDIVVECMPNYLHAEDSLLAFKAKKHLVLEKPVGITPEEVDALYKAATASEQKTVVSFLCRWVPLVANLKILVDSGAIGDVYYAGADYWHGIKPTFSSYPWIRKKEFAGGAMITGGCHAADIARYLNGEVAEVCAFATRARDDFDFDTTLSASVRFVNGSVGRLSACLDGLAYPYQFNIDVLGTKGAIRNGKLYSKELFPYQDDWVNLPMIEPNSGSVDHHPFKQEWDEFVSSIVNGTPVRSTVADACRSMDIALAVTESALTGKSVLVKQR